MEKTTVDEVAKLYDEQSELSDMLAGGQFHLSYWYDDQDTTSAVDASQRITSRVVEALGLRPGEHVLDAGCGMGTPAIWIAGHSKVRVTGITVSQVQVAGGNERAAASGMSEHVTFEYGDFMALSYPEGMFDAVIAIESLQEAPDLDKSVQELFRVLRPGGRMVISDCTTEREMNAEQAKKFRTDVNVVRPPTLAEWFDSLRGAGFEVEEYTQCGPRVYGRRSRYLEETDAIRDELVAKFGQQTFDELRAGIDEFFSLGSEYIGYAIIAARKPRT